MEAQQAPESVRYDAFRTLAAANSPRVLEVTENVPENVWVQEARLRNGDAVAGAKALSHHFDPASLHAWLESLIEQARLQHGHNLAASLGSLLIAEHLDDALRYGALCLAGYLADPALAEPVKVAWQNTTDRRWCLLPALWAGLRCAHSDPTRILGSMMPAILELHHDESGVGLDERDSLLQELGFATRHGVCDAVLSYLAELGAGKEEYRWIVAAVLSRVDHPIAIRYVVRLLADATHRAERSGRFSIWALNWGDRWKTGADGKGARLSLASVAALRSLWDDTSSPEWLQRYAFSEWSRHVRELAELRSVPATGPYFETAIWQRALRGDQEIVPHVLARLGDRQHWFYLVPRIWAREFEPLVDVALSELSTKPELQQDPWSNAHYNLAHLLRDIPRHDAERLLLKHWNELGRVPLFIQAAMYLGTDKCARLAQEALSTASEPFRQIHHFFGFFSQGLVDRLTIRHLESLRPYLARLEDHGLWEMVQFCRRYGLWDWAVQHLQPECRRRAQALKPDASDNAPFILRITHHWFPTDEELFADLDQFEQQHPRYQGGGLSYWWERFVERGDASERPPQVLEKWLKQSTSIARFRIVGRAIRDRGSRRDLAILRNRPTDSTCPEVEQILADAEYAVMKRSLG
jgi:hypothetical protein